jgi:hypothetical protein
VPAVAATVLLRAIADAPRVVVANTARARLRAQALKLAGDGSLLEPRYAYRFVDIDGIASGVLSVAGHALEAPWLVPSDGALTALACCVATLGDGLETRVRALFAARQAALACALDELGNELLLALSDRAQHRMLGAAKRMGLTLSGELRPGDPGLALDAQSSVLALAGASAIGVTLSRGCLMRPLKSASMVLGAGVGLPAARWSRCDPCPRRARCRAAA